MPTPDLIQGVPLPTYDDPAAIPDDLANVFYANLSRGIPRFSTTAQRDAAYPSPVDGQHCWIAAENAVYVRSSGAWRRARRAGDGVWQAYTPALSGWTLGNGSIVGAYALDGGTVHWRAALTVGTTTGTASSALIVGLPAPAAAASRSLGTGLATDASATGSASRRPLVAMLVSGGAVAYSTVDGGTMAGSSPFGSAFATGDTIELGGSYQAA